MRVVAGTARGRSLITPAGKVTRPTGDKVRQAMFNALGSLDLIEGVRLLDLFAGSGALGIEGLSRGASHCTFVEPDRDARRCVEANLKVVAGSSVAVVATNADRFLDTNVQRFDVALVDPPYGFDAWHDLLDRLPAEVAVIESNRSVDLPSGWEILRERTYGGTVVVFARRLAQLDPLAPE